MGGRVVGVLLSSGNRDARAERDGVEQGEVLDGKGPAVLIVVRVDDRELATAVALEIEGVPALRFALVPKDAVPLKRSKVPTPLNPMMSKIAVGPLTA